MRNLLKILFVMGMLSLLLGCGSQPMPEGRLLEMELTKTGTMAGNMYELRVERQSSGVVVLRGMKENYGPLYEKTLTESDVEGFVQIIRDEKMYRYKERYLPPVKVLDGYMWSFRAVFEGGGIYSRGSNAKPRGDGLKRLRELAEKLLQDGSEMVVDDAVDN